MKKRLFISSILMTLVLLVAITTATFAWYTASGQGGKIKASASDEMTIATVDPAYSAEAQELPLKVTVTRLHTSGVAVDGEHSVTSLELGTWTTVDTSTGLYSATGTAGWYHAYLDQNGTVHYGNKNNASYDDFAVYKVEITVQSEAYTDPSTGTQWSQEQIIAALKASGETIDIKVKAESDSRALFYTKAETPAVPTETGVDNFVLGTNVALTNLSGSAHASLTFYFCLYVDGENGTVGSSQSAEASAPNGDFKVLVTKHVAG